LKIASRWDFYTLESRSYGLCSGCKDLSELLRRYPANWKLLPIAIELFHKIYYNRKKRKQVIVMQTMLFKKNTDVKPDTQTKSCTQNTMQAKTSSMDYVKPDQPNLFCREHRTGMPVQLKNQIEQLSGYSMDDVRVHYNSDKPAQLQALAYTQGTDIHIAPGQERHLPHEAWHVVQQKQGRVTPTMQYRGIGINDNGALEHEADVMGNKALCSHSAAGCVQQKTVSSSCVQRFVHAKLTSTIGSEEGKSNGIIHTDWIKSDPGITIINKFKERITPKKISPQEYAEDRDRPIFQCAEPKALINYLAKYNDNINWEVFNSLKFDFVIDYPKNSTKSRYISPCDVCKQWVVDNRGQNEPLIKDAIITDQDIDLSKSNNEKKAEEEVKEKERQQKENEGKKSDQRQLLDGISEYMDLLKWKNSSEAKYLLEYALDIQLKPFLDEDGFVMWINDSNPSLSFDAMDMSHLMDRITEDNPDDPLGALHGFYDNCMNVAKS